MKRPFTLLILAFILINAPILFADQTREHSPRPIKLPNVAPALDDKDDLERMTWASRYCPMADEPFAEHIRAEIVPDEENSINLLLARPRPMVDGLGAELRAWARVGETLWLGTNSGLFLQQDGRLQRHQSYGINGPLATQITALASDSKGNLWVGTPIGLSRRSTDGSWKSIRGKQGLPVENITALAVDAKDRVWIGTDRGAILYLPSAKGRQWFYRAGKRYLIDDHVQAIAIPAGDMPVYFKTPKGISKLDVIERTLQQKAEIIETRLNMRHRRLGLVAACVLNDADNPTSYSIPDNDNDGLWTSYHVVAMSLAYAATGEPAYLESAKKSMHAMIMLQNASGIPGLVARSVVPASERSDKDAQWRLTPDGKMLWKSDTSSDEIDGHFFAFYAYWEHIAKNDPQEDALIKKQVRAIMDYIVDNNYQLIDWDGERTKWGFWNPENLNDDPEHYIENGLNSAQILSFLKTARHITGDDKYTSHFEKLIHEHGYLGNVLLEKKVFPDENNHSDNQLGFVAFYPWLQMEKDPVIRNALQRAVRRHYKTLWRDGSAFFYFAAASIDPDFVDIKAAVENLRRIPTDRRQWRMVNSHRADLIWNPNLSRFGRPQLLRVLPADERNWGKWNGNPYSADGGDSGRVEDDGASWLLAYWMGRYHGFIGE